MDFPSQRPPDGTLPEWQAHPSGKIFSNFRWQSFFKGRTTIPSLPNSGFSTYIFSLFRSRDSQDSTLSYFQSRPDAKLSTDNFVAGESSFLADSSTFELT